MPERVLAASVDELLAGVERREPFIPANARSRSRFERVWLDGEPHIVKYLHADDDFMLRVLGDPGSRTMGAFTAGLFDAAADVIDHAIVGAATGAGRDGTGCAVLMRDISDTLVRPGNDPFPQEQHDAFIDHLARMCAATWGWHDDVGLTPYPLRWTMASVDAIEAERRRGDPEGVAAFFSPGWEAFAAKAPDITDAVEQLRRDVTPLAAALAATPSCFLHGDWKASNLGFAPDGRTLLIDWVYLGEGPACHELGWYLALNRRKLRTSKEQVIADFRGALERHGVSTAGWWDRQLSLALLGTVLELGWEKTYGDDDVELGWWLDRAREGLALL